MATFRQPDRRSCGAAVLVMARMLAEPGYACWVHSSEDPAGRFGDEALRTHRRTNRVLDSHGRPQLPWPRALGTQPWALARELPGRHRVVLVRSRDRAWEHTVRADQPVPWYVGNDLAPRHVVLVVGRSSHDQVQVYEPGSGATVGIDRRRFLDGHLGLAGWDRPWLVLAPTDCRSRS